MATGAGKTFTAANVCYRLVRHADAARVLFLVDRANLGRQALREFQGFVAPDDPRKFSELYNVRHEGGHGRRDVGERHICTHPAAVASARGGLVNGSGSGGRLRHPCRSDNLPTTRRDHRP